MIPENTGKNKLTPQAGKSAYTSGPEKVQDGGERFTFQHSSSLYRRRGIVTWLFDESAFVVDGADDQTARWIGFEVAEENEMEVVWNGTVKMESGRFAAQFERAIEP